MEEQVEKDIERERYSDGCSKRCRKKDGGSSWDCETGKQRRNKGKQTAAILTGKVSRSFLSLSFYYTEGTLWGRFGKAFFIFSNVIRIKIVKVVIVYCFLEKMANPGLFFVYFRSFSNKQYNFTTNQCEQMSIQFTALGFEPTTSNMSNLP